VPFVIIQCLMVGLIIAFPDLVSGGLAKKATINTDQIRIEVPVEEPGAGQPLEGEEQQKGPEAADKDAKAGDDDAEKALERALKGDKK
jgi:hypothetical protein